MKTISYCLLLITAILCLAAGEKSNSIPKIKEMKDARGNLYKTFYYGRDGRITMLVSVGADTLTYTYERNYVYRNHKQGNYVNKTADTFVLNDKGLAVAQYGYGALPARAVIFDYDTDGHQVSWVDDNGNVESLKKSSYSEGNMTQRIATVIASGDKSVYTYDYTYYPDTRNTIDYENQGMPYMGKGSTNLVKEESSAEARNWKVRRLHYSYVYDDQGRVSMRITQLNDFRPDSSVFTYY